MSLFYCQEGYYASQKTDYKRYDPAFCIATSKEIRNGGCESEYLIINITGQI